MTRAATREQPPPRGALVPPLWREPPLPAAREPLAPVATESAQRGGGVRLSGWEGRGRAGAGPGPQQATRGVLLLLLRRRTSAWARALPSWGTRLKNRRQRVSRKENCPGPEYSGNSPKAGKPRHPLPSPSVCSCHTSCDCYVFHRRQWLSQATGGKTGLPFTFTPPLIPASS